METITNEERLQIFHAYNGAKVLHTEYGDRPIIGISSNGYIQLGGANHTYSVSNSDCQLLLKNLQSISDVDARLCASILEYSREQLNTFDTGEFLLHLEDIMNVNGGLYSDCVSGKILISLFDTLRSLGYNIGHGKYSPAELVEARIVKEI